MNEESNHNKNSFTAPPGRFTVEILFLCDTYIVVSLCNAISTIGEFKFLSTNIEMLPLGVTFSIFHRTLRFVFPVVIQFAIRRRKFPPPNFFK